MEIRTTKPSNNKYYIRQVSGGWNGAIQGKPTDPTANVLSNCVGYANGRFNEIGGYSACKYQFVSNPGYFLTSAKNYGLQISNKPELGGIMVWTKSDNDNGHVAIVERIDNNNQIYTSESCYNGTAFYNATRTNTNGRWGMSSSYTFKGCIMNPVIEPEPTPTPTPAPEPKFKIGDKVIINGALYTNANATSPAGSVTNKVTNITRYAEGTAHPYNTTGDLGWMNEADIQTYTEPAPAPTPEIKKGSKVKFVGTKSYSGIPLASWTYGYIFDVIEVSGDRVVIGKGTAVTSAVNINDCIPV